jgi:hypothetical protein
MFAGREAIAASNPWLAKTPDRAAMNLSGHPLFTQAMLCHILAIFA